jgi:hypothetical protein
MTKKRRVVSDESAQDLKIIYVPLDDLRLWEKNPRRNDAAAKKLARLIAKYGVKSPLVCTRDNVIRKGNTTYKALRILGHETAPVIYVEFPTEEQAALYSIADNKAGEFSEWDPSLLAELLGENVTPDLAELEEMTGFSQPEIAGIRDARINMPEGIGDEQLPEALEDVGIEGVDETMGRFILVYKDEEEKEMICKLLDIDGNKIVWSVNELGPQHGTRRVV